MLLEGWGNARKAYYLDRRGRSSRLRPLGDVFWLNQAQAIKIASWEWIKAAWIVKLTNKTGTLPSREDSFTRKRVIVWGASWASAIPSRDRQKCETERFLVRGLRKQAGWLRMTLQLFRRVAPPTDSIKHGTFSCYFVDFLIEIEPDEKLTSWGDLPHCIHSKCMLVAEPI